MPNEYEPRLSLEKNPYANKTKLGLAITVLSRRGVLIFANYHIERLRNDNQSRRRGRRSQAIAIGIL